MHGVSIMRILHTVCQLINGETLIRRGLTSASSVTGTPEDGQERPFEPSTATLH